METVVLTLFTLEVEREIPVNSIVHCWKQQWFVVWAWAWNPPTLEIGGNSCSSFRTRITRRI